MKSSLSTTSTSSLLPSASSPSSSSSSSPSRDSLAAIRRAEMRGDPANMQLRLSALCTVASACFHAASDLDSDSDSGGGSSSSSKSIATPSQKTVIANNPNSSKKKKKKRRRLSSCGCCCVSCVSSSPSTAGVVDASVSKRQKKVSDHTSIGLKSGAVVVEDSPVLAKACINAPVAGVGVQVGHDDGNDVVSVTDEESSVSSRTVEYSGSMEQHTRAKSVTVSAPTTTTTTTTSRTRNSSSSIRSWHRPLPFPLRLPKPFEAIGPSRSKTGRNGKKTLGPITATLIM
eukprot:CAMPEP_0113460754 /NCGR_PEP_ID=MMETSP0014_2-20120614/11161_1 /TAXON_ID=2857 /ORGANISM="Nitzschia sp." /LENGTH=286 /DNA_ID=CAMNT_0000352439 /DNA_START=200 /DNA_END=1060 /DNA_ORIENTATION=+ /assembly_acc=CAM_ASM_000159